jgi:hypothetical protein
MKSRNHGELVRHSGDSMVGLKPTSTFFVAVRTPSRCCSKRKIQPARARRVHLHLSMPDRGFDRSSAPIRGGSENPDSRLGGVAGI